MILGSVTIQLSVTELIHYGDCSVIRMNDSRHLCLCSALA